MKNFKWYRKLIGGYWMYSPDLGWQRANKDVFEATGKMELFKPGWALESYG